MTDTSSKAHQVQISIFRSMTPARRLTLATGWSTTLRELTRAGLREQLSDASEDELQRQFAERWLGPELASKAYGPMKVNG